MKKTSIALMVILAVVIAINVIDAIVCHRNGTFVDYSGYTMIYSILTISFAAVESGKKKEAIESEILGE